MMIIVSGLPGSGKSFFASRLANALNARYVSSDLTRKEMDAQGKYAFNDKLDVYEEMATRAGDFIRKGEEVVIDATFYRREMRQMFLTLARLLHEKVAYIEITADETLIIERMSVRRVDSEADFSVYELVKLQYEKLDNEHLVIESKSDNIDAMLTTAKEYIRSVNE